jgi:LEA14-like dessication related protein
MRSPVLLLGLSLSLLLSGCGTPPEARLERPVLHVKGLKSEGGTGILTLRIDNLNAVPMVIKTSTYTLSLGNQNFGPIRDNEMIGLPPTASADRQVTLPSAIASKLSAYLTQHPELARASVRSEFEVVTANDDTIKLHSAGSGLIKSP